MKADIQFVIGKIAFSPTLSFLVYFIPKPMPLKVWSMDKQHNLHHLRASELQTLRYRPSSNEPESAF